MLRSAIFLTGLLLASASDGHCALKSARAVDDLLDAATYIWASVQRCKKGSPTNNQILCSLDISNSIESVNAMINVMLKALDDCHQIHTKHPKCGLAVGVLTKAFAGLAASSSGIVAKCPTSMNGGKPLLAGNMKGNAAVGGMGVVSQQTLGTTQITQGNTALAGAASQASFAQCLVNVKDLTKSLFKATKRIITVKHNCNGHHKHHCAHNSLKIVASFAAMGEYLAGAVGRCSADSDATTKLRGGAQCASAAQELVRHLTNVGRASVAMDSECHVSEERLFELEHEEGVENQPASTTMTFALAAFLPITAVLGFVGGSRFAKSRVQPADDHTSLMEAPEVE